jgi:hypothetical protein
MRVKIRPADPPADTSGLEEFVVEASPDTDSEVDLDRPGAAGADPRPAATAVPEPPRRHVTAADLGPNGDRVADLLGRAGRLTPDECHKLEEAAGWRWWSMTPLPGTSVAGARAAALVRGRREGRADAIVALETAVQTVILKNHATRSRGSRLPAVIANSGLALLVRDLIDPETFETLFGPWREVMHH